MPSPIGRREDACYTEPDDELVCTSNEPNGGTERPPAIDDKRARDPSPGRGSSDGCDMLPDYLSVSLGAAFYFGGAGSAVIDRYENIYLAGSVSMATRGVGGSAMAGYLRDPDHPCDPPSETKLESFLAGTSRSEMVGAVIGAAVTTSGDMRAYEYGLATPQAGVNLTRTVMVHDHPNREAGESRR